MKILIVEDEEALNMVIKEELDSKGFDVKIAKNGEEALKLAKSFKPEAILLDLILPQKGGLEVLTELRADPNFKNTPVIILSNLAEDENIKKGLALGATDYFVKTQHSIYEVIEKVEKYLKK